MHHHYLSRSLWNADMKHVGGLRSQIIFGQQPEGICVESSSRCFLLLRTLRANIYQFTNYWTHVCPGTYKHSVCWEGRVCECIPAKHFIVCNVCLATIRLQTHVVQKHPWETGLLRHANVCCSASVFRQKGSGCKWHLHHLDSNIDLKAAAAQIDAKERMLFPSGYIKESDYLLHANSICTC